MQDDFFHDLETLSPDDLYLRHYDCYMTHLTAGVNDPRIHRAFEILADKRPEIFTCDIYRIEGKHILNVCIRRKMKGVINILSTKPFWLWCTHNSFLYSQRIIAMFVGHQQEIPIAAMLVRSLFCVGEEHFACRIGALVTHRFHRNPNSVKIFMIRLKKELIPHIKYGLLRNYITQHWYVASDGDMSHAIPRLLLGTPTSEQLTKMMTSKNVHTRKYLWRLFRRRMNLEDAMEDQNGIWPFKLWKAFPRIFQVLQAEHQDVYPFSLLPKELVRRLITHIV
jgi:hypothetical protein